MVLLASLIPHHILLSGEPTNPQICKPLQIGVSNQNMKRLMDVADQ